MPTNLMTLFGPDPGIVAHDAPSCLTGTPISPGPWADLSPVPSGAMPLEDRDGRILGWATDEAGHTSEQVMPEGRTPDEIAANARAMAAAWEALALLRMVAEVEPMISARLTLQGGSAERFLTDAAARARTLLRHVDGPSRRRR